MPVIENCMHCGKLCTDGFCPCRWPISVESMFDNTGLAPKEEGMPYDPNCQCMNCKDETKRRILDPYDPNVSIEDLRAESASQDHAAALRAHYDAAYLAALGGCSADSNSSNPQIDAHVIALESVRTHAARMQELERLIEEGE